MNIDKKRLTTIAKWLAIFILASGNIFSFLVTSATVNIIMALLVILYSLYEFFRALSVRKIHIGFRVYLFSFYLFALISLILGVWSFILGDIRSLLTCIIIIVGDTALILYSLHKMQ